MSMTSDETLKYPQRGRCDLQSEYFNGGVSMVGPSNNVDMSYCLQPNIQRHTILIADKWMSVNSTNWQKLYCSIVGVNYK